MKEFITRLLLTFDFNNDSQSTFAWTMVMKHLFQAHLSSIFYRPRPTDLSTGVVTLSLQLVLSPAVVIQMWNNSEFTVNKNKTVNLGSD